METAIPTVQTSETSSSITLPATATHTETEATISSGLPSTAFSHLAKKEAELVRRRQEFKKEQDLVAAEKAKIKSINDQIQLFEQTKKTDPVAALKMIGFSETDIFNYMAANEKKELTPEEKAAQAAAQAAEEKIKAFEEAQAKKIEQAEKERDNALLTGFKSDLSKIIETNKEQFEYCAYYGEEAADLAYEITLAVVKESNGEEVLSPKEAIQEAEAYFEQKDIEMNQLNKRIARNTPPVPQKTEPTRTRTITPPTDPQWANKPTITRQRTLTNAATAIGTKPRAPETRDQKRERLMNMLRNGG